MPYKGVCMRFVSMFSIVYIFRKVERCIENLVTSGVLSAYMMSLCMVYVNVLNSLL